MIDRRAFLCGAAGALLTAGLLPRRTRAAGTPAMPRKPITLPTEETVLKTLRPGHPRLILLPDDIARVKNFVATDENARAYSGNVTRYGEAILSQAPVVHELIGPRLLAQSRDALERVYTLALLARLDGSKKWVDRAMQEMRAATAFPDWNPSHFLDVAEMTHAFAIGYDWLYPVLAPEERAVVKGALVEKGLREYAKAYQKKDWWTENPFNWNNVCNGGAIAGALAIADEEPELARSVLSHALTGLPYALASYAPDGAWAEGPAYWGYATRYTILAFAALQSALGTDFGLSASPGLSETGEFRLQSVGPTNLFFNFADAGDYTEDEPSLFWLARRYDDSLLAWGARENARGWRASARDVIWYDPQGTQDELAKIGKDAHYKAVSVAFFRSSWTDPNALYVGFKGGDNKANHAHLDLGTFVLDALGERWAIDLGPDDYNLPDYFGDKRWTYYRLSTLGHNTITLDSQNQDPKAAAPLTRFHSGPDGGFAVADLSAGYAPQGATRVQRGIALRDGRTRVLVQDEMELSRPVSIVWAMHTHAQVAIAPAGNQATLTLGGKAMQARILSPSGARFTVEEVTIPPPQRPLKDVRKLLVAFPGKTTSARLAVLLTPGSTDGAAVTLRPLADWSSPQSGGRAAKPGPEGSG